MNDKCTQIHTTIPMKIHGQERNVHSHIHKKEKKPELEIEHSFSWQSIALKAMYFGENVIAAWIKNDRKIENFLAIAS